MDQIVDIASDGRHLSLHRGFMKVSADGQEVGRVPLDMITAVIIHGHGSTISANLIEALSERQIFVVFCGRNHAPVACLWPLSGHHLQGARMRAQWNASTPLKKRLWQRLIKAKIGTQGAVLEAVGKPAGAFEALTGKVRSGDPDNIEAQAARRYWSLLMGDGFRRDRNIDGANALLNYGYAVVRATCARAIVAAGLHPTVGVHHHAGPNDFALADDLIEPFRPYVDLKVYGLVKAGLDAVGSDTKAALTALLAEDVQAEGGVSPIGVAIKRAAQSLAAAFESGENRLDLPDPPPSMQLAAFAHAGG